ncbi:hypothetical protein [Acetobacter oeni]|uniref:Uncharacterized protein n=1 Tax=Acetobacter oeni TaxID=304077 RepID=A0A511XIJ9_9PROT|nr:hypothetical protein [Acetobacter oeni]MBB3881464.1 hypothetical protein [Acetobacter oeni]NHO18329.1 hypothetical protein [Acetobacter oeni]GBR10905.1 hypothetical protein AA21952_3205 [Acetobacter oeni LMG 21952]GEN62741.1 hypothetical protein AOE01nite_09650 [Acetobacter oeni]
MIQALNVDAGATEPDARRAKCYLSGRTCRQWEQAGSLMSQSGARRTTEDRVHEVINMDSTKSLGTILAEGAWG